MAPDEVERLGEDERLQHRFHRLSHELPQLLRPQAPQDDEPVLRGPLHRLVARAARDEKELPERRLGELRPRDQPALAERPGERERTRAPEQRPVEVEEGRPGHPD